MIAPLIFAATSVITFRGYVPPHAAADGVRFDVVAAPPADLPAEMKACGIDDYRQVGAGRYDFAVTRATQANAACLRSHLPATAQITPLNRWEADADGN